MRGKQWKLHYEKENIFNLEFLKIQIGHWCESNQNDVHKDFFLPLYWKSVLSKSLHCKIEGSATGNNFSHQIMKIVQILRILVLNKGLYSQRSYNFYCFLKLLVMMSKIVVGYLCLLVTTTTLCTVLVRLYQLISYLQTPVPPFKNINCIIYLIQDIIEHIQQM